MPLGYPQDLCGYWAEHYDWRAGEARLNQVPQFTTALDGLDIHFLHARSPHPGAVPLIMTHGGPGSFLELEQGLGPLTDPPAHGGNAADAFHVVVPSLPGYGFSGKPAAAGWDVHRIARARAELTTRLGYERFLATGSDWGTSISASLAPQRPGRLPGIHLMPPLAPPDRAAGDLTDDERTALADLDERSRTGSGYPAIQGTRPQTTGYSLTDSPTGLCAWITDKLRACDRPPWRPRPGTHRRPGAGQRHLVLADRHPGRPRPGGTGRAPPKSPTGSPPPPATPSPSRPGAASSPKRYRGLPPPGRAPLHQHRLPEPARPRRPLRRPGTAQPAHQRSPRHSTQLRPALR